MSNSDSMKAVKIRNPRQTACTECIKRKQKYKPGKGASCFFCTRLWPIVQCVKLSDVDKNDTPPIVFETVPNVKSLATYNYGNVSRRATKNVSAELSPFGGYLSAAQAANMAPADPFFQKAELLHFFNDTVSPSLFSIDGKNAPPVFYDEISGWLVQGTVMPELSALTSFTIQNNIIGKDSIKTVQALDLRGKIYALMKKVVGQNPQVVSEEAIQALLHLATVEVLWGDHDIYSAHFKGIQGVLNAQGGIDSLKNPLLKRMIVIGDYQISIYGEHELLFHHPPPYEIGGTPIAVPYPENFNSPLLDFSAKFVDIYPSQGLNLQIAAILDDVRDMTLSVIISFVSGEAFGHDSRDPRLISASTRIQQLPIMDTTNTNSELDAIYEVCRMAALTYSSCITSRIPLSQGLFQDLPWLYDFRSKIWTVSLCQWQKIPGIFLWVLLVAAPSTQDDASGVQIRLKLSSAALYIAVQGHDLAMSALRSFYTIQRWLAKSKIEVVHDTRYTFKNRWPRKLEHRMKG